MTLPGRACPATQKLRTVIKIPADIIRQQIIDPQGTQTVQKLNPVPILIVAILMSGNVIANDNPDFRYIEPDGVALPQGSYGLGIVIEPNYRLAFLTGRTGSNQDGSYSNDFETQARNALASVGQLLNEVDMDWSDVVKINVYLTDCADIPVWGRVSDEIIGASRPGGTGVIVKALASPDARVEVTVIAAQKVD